MDPASTESLLALGRQEQEATFQHLRPSEPGGSTIEVEVVDIRVTTPVTAATAAAVALYESVSDWWIAVRLRPELAGWGEAVA